MTLTIDALNNATYQVSAYGTIQLTNGKYTDVKNGWTAGILDIRALGDLNNDGQTDAAVLLWVNGGGSGQFIHLAAVIDDRGTARNAATILLGDRVRVQALTIAGGQIRVDLIVQGPKDPLCCPTQKVVQTYQLQGNQLSQLTQQIVGTVPFPSGTSTA